MSDEESFVILGSCSGNNSLVNIESIRSAFQSLEQSKIMKDDGGKVEEPFYNKNDKKETIELAQAAEKEKPIESICESSPSMDGSQILNKSIEMNVNKIIEDRTGDKNLSNTPIISSAGSVDTVSKGNSLAASFILGEVQADVLKSSVYSQFPSLCSMEPNAEEFVKLQNILSEYVILKGTLAEVNTTMRKFYTKTQQWRDDVQRTERQYKEELQQCKNEIVMLRNENKELRQEIQVKIDKMEAQQNLFTQKSDLLNIMDAEREKTNNLGHEMEENVQKLKISNKKIEEISEEIEEKSALIKNMQAQIKCLEEKLATYENKCRIEKNDTETLKSSEYMQIIKGYERQMSELMAENLEITHMKQIYLDEINCLKVNLVSAEEMLQQSRSDIELLKAKDTEKSILFSKYDKERDGMREEIGILRHQIEVYSKDFQMERTARESLAGEKDELLKDLRMLQRTNQQLIEEQQRHLESVTSSTAMTSNAAKTSADTNAKNQRFPAQNDNNRLQCPICLKGFDSLPVLVSHVNRCLDTA